MTETVSNFPCTECEYEHMTFKDGETFECPRCGYSWKLSGYGVELLRSLE